MRTRQPAFMRASIVAAAALFLALLPAQPAAASGPPRQRLYAQQGGSADSAAAAAARRMQANGAATREQLQKDKQQQQGGCRNTQQGRWQVADDRGYVCDRAELDYASGCCQGGTRHACGHCNNADRCCDRYEHCVSCCMAPANGMQALVASAPRAPGRPDTGRWGSLFELCAGACRTSSNSTVHENDYVAPRHHCFSADGRPMVPPLPAAVPEQLRLLAAEKGEDCATACERAGGGGNSGSGGGGGLACAPGLAAHANNCNTLRRHFICQAGCEVSEGADQPSYVAPDAPKAHRPTMCFVNDATPPPSAAAAAHTPFACNGSHPHTQRLCPCAPVALLR